MTIHGKSIGFGINSDGQLVLTVRRRYVQPGALPVETDWTVAEVLEGEQDAEGAWVGEPVAVLRAFDGSGNVVDCDAGDLATFRDAMVTARVAWLAWDAALGEAVNSGVL
jgi:hypothetical protein